MNRRLALTSIWIALCAAGCSVDTTHALCTATADCPNAGEQCVPGNDGGLGVCQASTAVTSSGSVASSGSTASASTGSQSSGSASTGSAGSSSIGSTGTATSTSASSSGGTITSGSSGSASSSSSNGTSGSSGSTGCGADLDVCAGGICRSEVCTASCEIGGVAVDGGDANPANTCELCAPDTDPQSWTNQPDGFDCAASEICSGGACSAGCFVDGGFFGDDAGDPNDVCAGCVPSLSTHGFSGRPDGFACASTEICVGGACKSACEVNGQTQSPGDVDPQDPCESCDPSTSTQGWSALPDALNGACATNQVCHAGACAVGCFVSGSYRANASANPADPCQSCQAASSNSAWTNSADGTNTACNTGQVCHGGNCTAGCFIAGNYWATGVANPTDPCQACAPTSSVSAWSNDADGTNASCSTSQVCHAGNCTTGCFIAGSYYASGAANPADPCQTCVPASSVTAWTNSADGSNASCNSGQVCHAGVCTSGCFIGTAFEANGAVNPADPCQKCAAATSTTSWTALADGTNASCGSGQVCHAGACTSGCFISGSYVATGTLGTGSCVSCQPATSTTTYSAVSNGTTCPGGAGHICFASSCQFACDIGGALQNPNDTNGGNTCQTCQPATSTSAYSSLSDGTACNVAGGDFCHNGGSGSTCQNGCFISGTYYASGTVNPGNPCQVCTPTSSQTAWTTEPEGLACGTGKVCNGTVCTSGCFISNVFYASGARNPANDCEVCTPATHTTAWSNEPNATSCNSSTGLCNATGSCVTCPVCGGSCCSPNSCQGSPLRCQ